MSAYRDPAPVSSMPVVVVPQGLVRANGSRCTCRPPGRLWCWWYSVQPKDRWYCIHGGGWVWTSHAATTFPFFYGWAPVAERPS